MKTLRPIRAVRRPLLALTLLGLFGAQPFVAPAARAQATATLTTLHDFGKVVDGGQNPLAGLLLASDGNLYGVTTLGGSEDEGTFYRVTPERTITFLHSFTGFDGAVPQAGLIQGADGNLDDFTLGSTVYYYPDPKNVGRYNTDGVRYFYVFSTGQIISK